MSLFADTQQPDFWSWVQNQAPSIIFLCGGIYIVGRALIAVVTKLNAISEERMQEYRQRIEKLEQRVNDCEEDRRDLRKKIESKV